MVLLLKCGYNRQSLRWATCNFRWGAWWLLATLRGNNGLGRFEFAFFFFFLFFFLFFMIEKFGFVLEYNYACLIFFFFFWISLSLLLVFFLSWGFLCILKISIGLREKQAKNEEKNMDEEKSREKYG